MKTYDILIDFRGSQDGSAVEEFIAGTRRDLTDWLAEAAPHGAIRAVGAQPESAIQNKAVITDGAQTKPLKRK